MLSRNTRRQVKLKTTNGTIINTQQKRVCQSKDISGTLLTTTTILITNITDDVYFAVITTVFYISRVITFNI